MHYDCGDFQGLCMFNVSIKSILTSKNNTKKKIIILFYVQYKSLTIIRGH